MNMKMKLGKMFLALTATSLLASCGGGGGATGGTTNPSGSYHTSPYVTASGFVSALNSVDGTYYNELVKDKYDTDRNDEDFFVIWDAEYGQYVGVSLDYLKTVEYYSYYSDNVDLADEFRNVQSDDEFFGGLIGDGYGNDYEVVTYDYTDLWGEDHFQGVDTGLMYGDEDETKDVTLMVADQQKKAFFLKASKISVLYDMDIKKAAEVVSLGDKLEVMVSNSNGIELTQKDQLALASDIERLTGKTASDFQKALEDQESKEELLSDVAKKMKISADTLENKLLPELLQVEL